MMAAIVVPGRHADRERQGGSASSTASSTLAVLPLRYVSGEADAPYLRGRAHRPTHHDAGADSLAQGDRADIRCALQGDGRSGLRDRPQLGVDGIVEGTVAVQKGTGNQPARARVNVRVIKAGTDVELWSGRSSGHWATCSHSSRSSPARSLESARRADAGRSVRTCMRVTEDRPAAEQAYFEGRAHLALFADPRPARARRRSSVRSPSTRFTRRRTPALPGATWRSASTRAISQPEARASAVAEATRALELDDGLAEAHGVLG